MNTRPAASLWVALTLLSTACVGDASSESPDTESSALAAGSPGVTGVSLVLASNAKPLAGYDPVASGATIALGGLPSTKLSLFANVQGAVGSIGFNLDHGGLAHTENYAPYSLCGDRTTSATPCPQLDTVGPHSLVVTAYAGQNLTGAALDTVTLDFSVVSSEVSPPPVDAGGISDPGASPPPGYALVWEDTFDTGTQPDSAKWTMYDSPGNGGNGLRRPSAFSVHDGVVDVVAQMENGQLVSGGMAALYHATYGYFEFRVRSEVDPSEATDAVVLTWPVDGVWPEHGENDIYETGTAASRDPFHTFIHYGTTASTQHAFTEAADGTAWHVMGMEWTPEAIAIYRDGALVGTVTDASAIPHWDHMPCIQLDAYRQAMGGPVHMYVDWIRVYQR